MQPQPVPIHRRQLILGPTEATLRSGWSSTELPGTGVLTHAPDLPVAVVRDADGMAWCLAGLAKQSDPGSRDPIDQLVRARTAHVPSLYHSWAGRWMLVGAGEVHLDATGLLGCLYARGPDGACWMSSSAALLADLWGPSHVTRDSRVLRHARGLDWIPAPGSRYPPLRRLLPSRILDVRSGSTRPRPWLREPGSGLPYPAILEMLQARLGEPLRRLGTNEVWVPLTGGQDSRLVLALALAAGLRIHAYTNERDMTLADRLLPRRVARAAGVPYAFHRPGPANHARGIGYDMHGSQSTAGIDRSYYVMGQWDFGKRGDFVLRGGGFEAGRAYYYDRLPADLDRVSAGSLAGAFGEPANSPAEADLGAWLDGIRVDPIPLLDWRDRFYLEQRLGAWLSAIEQELDLTGRERFYAINAEATYRLLLDLPEEIRRTGQHQLDLTRRLAPELLRFPLNPPDIAFGRLAVAIDRFRRKRRNMRQTERRLGGRRAVRRSPADSATR